VTRRLGRIRYSGIKAMMKNYRHVREEQEPKENPVYRTKSTTLSMDDGPMVVRYSNIHP
jgi:hypothetical protein